jgi:hypothetical protein
MRSLFLILILLILVTRCTGSHDTIRFTADLTDGSEWQCNSESKYGPAGIQIRPFGSTGYKFCFFTQGCRVIPASTFEDRVRVPVLLSYEWDADTVAIYNCAKAGFEPEVIFGSQHDYHKEDGFNKEAVLSDVFELAFATGYALLDVLQAIVTGDEIGSKFGELLGSCISLAQAIGQVLSPMVKCLVDFVNFGVGLIVLMFVWICSLLCRMWHNPLGTSVQEIVIMQFRQLLEIVSFGFYQYREVLGSVRAHKISASMFKTLGYPRRRPARARGDEHPKSAALRNSFYEFAKSVATLLGKVPYVNQVNDRAINAGLEGWNVNPRPMEEFIKFTPSEKHLHVYVDTDYESQLDTLMLGQPHLFYTFVPETAGTVTDEYSYSFADSQNVSFFAAGGQEYCTPLWNWNRTECVVWNRGGKAVHYYRVTRKLGPDRFAVLLLPLYFSSYWGSDVNDLERLEMVGKETFAYRTITNSCSSVNIGAYNNTASIVLPERVFGQLLNTHRALKAPGISSETIQHMAQISRADAGVVLRHLREHVELSTFVIPKENGTLSYQWNDFHENHKVQMRAIFSPLIHKGYVPVRSRGNDKRCQEERITKLQEHACDDVDACFHKYADEFIELTSPTEKLVPLSPEAVLEKQERPQQKANTMRGLYEAFTTQIVKCFQKAEAYGGPNDPRNISQDPPHIKLRAATFAYSVMEHIKTFTWYAFGRSPADVAQKVADLCEENQTATETDYSRWDGKLTKFLKYTFAQYLVRCFGRSDELDDVIATRNNRKIRSQHGLKCESGYSQLSGDMFTSVSNSWLNAFVCYCAARESGLSPAEAFRNFGIFGGDDGLTPVSKFFLENVAARLHLTLKARECNPDNGEWPTFLSRQFGPDVWRGDPNTTCDIPRQLAKLHLTTNMEPNIDIAVKIKEKAFALNLTDSNTPIVGAVCQALLKQVENVSRDDLNGRHMKFWYRLWDCDSVEGAHWPNEVHAWRDDLLERYRMSEWIDTLDAHLAKEHSLESLCEFPCLSQAPVPPKQSKPVPVVEANEEESRPQVGQYPCELCGKTFNKKKNRTRHMKGTHQQPVIETTQKHEDVRVVVQGVAVDPTPADKLESRTKQQVQDLAVKLAANIGSEDFIYEGSYGRGATKPLLAACDEHGISVQLHDPMYTRDPLGSLIDKTPNLVNVSSEAFVWEEHSQLFQQAPVPPFYLNDSPLPESTSAQIDHFKSILKTLTESGFGYALVKAPKVAFEQEMEIPGGALSVYHATDLDGSHASHRYVYIRIGRPFTSLSLVDYESAESAKGAIAS